MNEVELLEYARLKSTLGRIEGAVELVLSNPKDQDSKRDLYHLLRECEYRFPSAYSPTGTNDETLLPHIASQLAVYIGRFPDSPGDKRGEATVVKSLKILKQILNYSCNSTKLQLNLFRTMLTNPVLLSGLIYRTFSIKVTYSSAASLLWPPFFTALVSSFILSRHFYQQNLPPDDTESFLQVVYLIANQPAPTGVSLQCLPPILAASDKNSSHRLLVLYSD